MHIAINGMFWGQPMVGSGQYLHGLLAGLARIAPELRVTLLLPAYQNATAQPGAPAQIRVTTPFDGRNQNLAKLWFEQIGVPLAAARIDADLLHVPYAAPPLHAPMPVVATIHDIIPLLLPEYRGRRAVRAYMRLIPPAARRTAQIIADSEHSRRDIQAHLGCQPERVTTIPLAAGEQYRPIPPTEARAMVLARYGIQEPFVYYVGGFDARKNVPTLVRAFARMRRAGGPPATLVLAGRSLGGDPLLFPDINALIDKEQAQPFITRIDAAREDNPLLYAAATTFAYPSRYEGFGLPPLEAMACGVPVIVAEASSLPEVVGDAALRVAADDEAAWAAALWRLLANTALRDDLRARGLQRAATFSYERVARATLAVYNRVG